MNNIDFFLLFEENIMLFAVVGIPVVGAFVYLSNKIADSWMNPTKIKILGVGILTSIATALYVLGEVKLETYIYVMTSTFIFFSIIYIMYPRSNKVFRLKIVNDEFYSQKLFDVFYFGYILMTLFSYIKFGIPLFNSGSRLNTFQGSGGFGIIPRISHFIHIYISFFLFNRYYQRDLSLIRLVLWISPLVVFGILSGSRSSFLSFVFSWWGYNKFYLGKSVFLSKYKPFLILFVVVSVLTFALESAVDFYEASNKFFERVVATGDLYWMSLPEEVWRDVSVKTPISDLFVGFLAPMRLMNESDCDVAIGVQLFQIHTNNFYDTAGPPEAFQVSSLIYFGYVGGLVFTVIQALVACFFAKLFYRQSGSLIFSSLLFYAFELSLAYMTAFKDATGYMFNVLLNVIVVIIICMAITILASLLNSQLSRINKTNA